MSVIGDAPANGVYTFGNYTKNYPAVLDLTYPLSIRSSGALVTSGLEIGSVIVAGDVILVSWYNHNDSTYGVDALDYNEVLSGAYIVTTQITFSRHEFTTWYQFVASYVDLPTGTNVEIQYSKDYGTTWKTTTEVIDTMRQIITAEEGVEATNLFFKVIFTCNDTDSPVLDAFKIYNQ